MAAEVLAALFAGGRGHDGRGPSAGGAWERGPQWKCHACNDLPNDASRQKCRRCGGARSLCEAKGGEQRAQQASLDVAPTPLRPWPRAPAPEERAEAAASKATALEAAAASLRAAGLEEEAAAHEKSAAALRKAAVSEPAGGRLDACAGFVARAEKRVEAARSAVQAAEAALEEARAAQRRLEDELAEGRDRLDKLRAELFAAPGGLPEATPSVNPAGGFVEDVKGLLTLMEGGACQFGVGSGTVLETMRRLHTAMEAFAPAPTPDVSGPLEPSVPAAAVSGSAALNAGEGKDEEEEDEDAAMKDLQSAESGDEEAIVAAARRLRQSKSSKLGLVTKLKPEKDKVKDKDRDKRR